MPWRELTQFTPLMTIDHPYSATVRTRLKTPLSRLGQYTRLDTTTFQSLKDNNIKGK